MEYYRLWIWTDPLKTKHSKLESILLKDTPLSNIKFPHSIEKETDTLWIFEVEESEISKEHFHFISVFYDTLKDKFEDLAKIGITNEDIQIWYLYEYDQQCGMEFCPDDMGKLASLGVTLCIDCWQKG